MAEGETFDRDQEVHTDIAPDPKCSCCDERYRKPLYLQCGHTIDKHCIRKQKRHGSGKCPICRQPYNVRAAQNFPQNFLLERFATLAKCREVAEKLLKNPKCEFDNDHQKTINAVVHCSRCKLNFCKKCINMHDKIPEARKHMVYKAEIEEMEKKLKEGAEFCKEHGGKKIIYWCLDCKIPVCADCCACKTICDISEYARCADENLGVLKRHLDELLSKIIPDRKNIKENEKHLDIESTDRRISLEASVLRFNVIQGSVNDIYTQCLYLKRELKLLIAYGGDVEKVASLQHLSMQWKNIQTATHHIHSRSVSTSSSEMSSVLDSYSVRSAGSASGNVEENPENVAIYENIPSQSNAINVKRNAVLLSEENNIYMNEMSYDDAKVCLRKPSTKDTKITKKLHEFDAEFRITGMTLLDDIIVVTSRSAGICAGYSYEAPGKQIWINREKLNGPFDVDSYRLENDKHYLIISDPGQTDESKSAVRVFVRKKNERYKYSKDLTTECHRPRGVCVFAERVYICEPVERQVTEYSISQNLTGKIFRKYNEPDVLKEPIYVAAQVINDRVILIISDNQIGLKRLVKGEDTGDSKFPAWAVSKEKTFTPSKCFTVKRSGKSEVIVGNSSGHKISVIDFESRQVNHLEYSLDDGCFGPIAVGININDQTVVACKDGTIILYNMIEKNDENIYQEI